MSPTKLLKCIAWRCFYYLCILVVPKPRRHRKVLYYIIVVGLLCVSVQYWLITSNTNESNLHEVHTLNAQPQSNSECTGSNAKHAISQPPNFVTLVNLRVFENIPRRSYHDFGTLLLIDEGGKLDTTINDHNTVEEKNREIFKQWLRGDGKTPTWNTLIVVLREIRLHRLADSISSKVLPSVCNSLALPYDYSVKILKSIESLKEKYRMWNIVQIDHIKPTQANLPYLELILKGKESNFKNLSNVLDSMHLHKQLLITGQPGSGKTTMMRYLAKQWAEGKAFQFCQILFLLSLEFYRVSYHNLRDLLSVQYTEWEKYAEDIMHRNGNGTCFLLDAFDEKLDKKDFVHRLTSNDELSLSVRILTSRSDDDLPVEVRKHAVEVVGFQFEKLDSYLYKLSDNTTAEKIKKEFWKDRQVKEMCQLPQHMAMIIVIAQTKHTSSIKTKTQIYTAFVNATIDHYKSDHPNWDIHALRQCVLNKLDDNLCEALKMISHTAFEMTFNHKYEFFVEKTLEQNINCLGIVSLELKDVAASKFKFNFSHPTYMEFFAALHLVTKSQGQQRFHIQNPEIKSRQGVVDFYFGLLGDIHAKNAQAVALPLKHYSTAFAAPLNRWEHVCPSKYYRAHSSSSLRLHQEIGWKGDAYRSLLKSAGIVVDSSACISVSNSTIHSSHYLLQHAKVSKLSIIGYSTSLSAVTFEDKINPLNITHLNLLNCLDRSMGCVNEGLHSTVTYVHFKPSTGSNQSRTDLETAINSLEKFQKVQSFGLTIYNPELLISNEHPINLTGLTITSLEIHCSCYEQLQIILQSFPNITTLYLDLLSTCKSEKKSSIRPLSRLLKQPHQLQNLIIRLSDVSIEKLLKQELKALSYLRIEEMTINGATAAQLINNVNKNLKILDLSNCKLRGLAVQTLGKHLHKFSNLQNLNVYHSDLSDTDVSTISQSIKRLPHLTYLGLANNKINGEGLQQLVEVLKEIQVFRSLNLYGNPITGQENLNVLLPMINLRTLHVSISSDEDKVALSDVVLKLSQLESFRWSKLES